MSARYTDLKRTHMKHPQNITFALRFNLHKAKNWVGRYSRVVPSPLNIRNYFIFLSLLTEFREENFVAEDTIFTFMLNTCGPNLFLTSDIRGMYEKEFC
jgi:hypothetical protein